MLKRTRRITGPLAIFDLGLGLVATVWPDFYAELMHGPLHPDADMLIRRTGILWLVFSLTEAIAFLRWDRWPATVLCVSLLRLMDVPADTIYFLSSDSLTTLGRASLLIAPIFNLTIGAYLFSAWRRHTKSTTPPNRPIPRAS